MQNKTERPTTYRLFAFMLFLMAQPALYAQLPYAGEAEKATLKGHVTPGDDSTASGGKYVHLSDSGAVLWPVRVPASGYYLVTVRYRCRKLPMGERSYFVRNGDSIPNWYRHEAKLGRSLTAFPSDWRR